MTTFREKSSSTSTADSDRSSAVPVRYVVTSEGSSTANNSSSTGEVRIRPAADGRLVVREHDVKQQYLRTKLAEILKR